MLYHYCSLESFINIMKNKSFWLSDVRKSNDRDECMHFFKFLKARIELDDDISKELKDLALKHISDYAEQYSYGKGIRKYLPSREFEIANIVEGDEYCADLRIPPVHVLCLSEEGNLLSQWRGYADDGGGIAIGLREEFLDQTGDSMFLVRQDDGNYKFLRCEKIHYDDLVTLKAMESTRLSVYDNCKEQLKLINKQERSPEESEMLETLKEGLWNLLRGIEFRGITYKSDGFSEEKEHRIIEVDPHDFNPSYSEIEKQKNVLSEKDSRALEKKTYFHISELKFRARDKDIVSHYELKFDKIMNQFIGEIVLGPTCKARTSDIEMMLQSFGYKDLESIYIHRSSLSYR